MIDVEQHPLCAFEQDPFSGAAGLVEFMPDGFGVGQDGGGDFGERGHEALAVNRRFAKPRPQRIMMRAQPVNLWCQSI